VGVAVVARRQQSGRRRLGGGVDDRALDGSIGLVASVPIATALVAKVLTRRPTHIVSV
jgi:hypothetical protein